MTAYNDYYTRPQDFCVLLDKVESLIKLEPDNSFQNLFEALDLPVFNIVVNGAYSKYLSDLMYGNRECFLQYSLPPEAYDTDFQTIVLQGWLYFDYITNKGNVRLSRYIPRPKATKWGSDWDSNFISMWYCLSRSFYTGINS